MYSYYYNHTEKLYKDLYNYLMKHDEDFPIRLSDKVDLKEYLKKICNLGKSIICMQEQEIVGIILYYDNNVIDNKAFVSLVSVDMNHRNKGIANNMLLELFKNLRNSGIKTCEVPTHNTNHIAIKLYKSLGFEIDYINDNGNLHLIKKLNEVD